MTKPKAIVKPAVSDSLKGKWFVVVDDSSRYLRHDMTLHQNMMGEGGTYFDTREEAQELADRFNGDLPHADDPKTWGEMTDAEKGALLLAHHEGKLIEAYTSDGWRKVSNNIGFSGMKYRVRPEPKRDTVEMTCGISPRGFWCAGSEKSEHFDTHRITFDTIDGDPDCDSIRMEALDND